MKAGGIIALALIGAASLTAFGGIALAQQDRYTLTRLGQLSFRRFQGGYENWRVVAVSQTKTQLKVILANDVMMDAYRQGLPADGKLFPEGSKVVGEDRVEHEKEHQGALLCGGAERAASGRDNRKRQQEIPGHAWMGASTAILTIVPRLTRLRRREPGRQQVVCVCHTRMASQDSHLLTAYPFR